MLLYRVRKLCELGEMQIMRSIILANGEYGDLRAYPEVLKDSDLILCADGGANYAYQLGLIPDCIIGDLDSIKAEVKCYYERQGVEFKKYPARKDCTDVQLALELAAQQKTEEIIMLGSLGKRLDHTLANIYACINLVLQGIKISHYTPECWVYTTNREITIEGCPGDIVSVLALSDEVLGVSETGFEYSLNDSVMRNSQPYAVSNVLSGHKGTITVQSGVLAVIHYYCQDKNI